MLRHNLIARGALAATWAECTGTAAELEPPTTLVEKTTAKADVALTSVDGARYLFDVSICQPDSVQALRLRSDTKPGVAAALTTNLKSKHNRFSDPPVTPLVWEAYGTPHKDTRKALGRIATAAAAFQRVTRDAEPSEPASAPPAPGDGSGPVSPQDHADRVGGAGRSYNAENDQAT
jgi:hypothetical protein